MTHKAYSVLTVKSTNEERRIIEGVASTPTADRQRDIVEPMGAKFKTPMPLLLYHKGDKPVGTMNFAKPTKEGIPFVASLPNVLEPGIVQDRVNEAWHSLKYKLIGAVSIGFRALEDGVEIMKDGGLRFKSWEWLELSLVTVPANPDALISGIKSMDAAAISQILGAPDDEAEREALITAIKAIDTSTRAALGLTRKGVVYLDPAITGQPTPGASGTEGARRPGVVYLNES
jgi:hypothetical protein